MPRLVNFIFARPRAILPLLDAAAVSAQERIYSSSTFLETHPSEEESEVEHGGHPGIIKRMVRVRIDFHRLSCPGVSPAVNHIRSRHTGRLLTLYGTVTRLGTVKSHEVEQLMECTSCGLRFLVSCNRDVNKPTELPTICPSAGDQQTKRCKNTLFRVARTARPVVATIRSCVSRIPSTEPIALLVLHGLWHNTTLPLGQMDTKFPVKRRAVKIFGIDCDCLACVVSGS